MPLKLARSLYKENKIPQAEEKLKEFISAEFGLHIDWLKIRKDGYSLNSLNGFFANKQGAEFFFKFHQEDGEENTIEEYYRANILEQAGFPIETPIYQSGEAGKQMLIYRAKSCHRLADLCLAIEKAERDKVQAKDKEQIGANVAPSLASPSPSSLPLSSNAESYEEYVVKAQEQLDKQSFAIYQKTLHQAGEKEIWQEPIHQLFFHRLVDNIDDAELGGRVKEFYFESKSNSEPVATDFLKAKWQINGTEYQDSLLEIFTRAKQILHPKSLLDANLQYAAITAHGDAHNANIWYDDGGDTSIIRGDASNSGGKNSSNTDEARAVGQASQLRQGLGLKGMGLNGLKQGRLIMFDPAFASDNLPAILAEVKAIFHNIFAHPFLLYNPAEAAKIFDITMDVSNNVIKIQHNWQLSKIRRRFLKSKLENLVQPLLKLLQVKGLLPQNYQEIIELALFCCPTLVMNLTEGRSITLAKHNQTSSMICFAIAVMLGSDVKIKPSNDAANNLPHKDILALKQGLAL